MCGIISFFLVIIFIAVLVMQNDYKNNTFENAIKGAKIVCMSPFCTLASDNSYLKIDTNPYDNENSDTLYLHSVEKLNKQLGFSSSTYQKMLNTRPIDGKQTDETNKVKVSWSYTTGKGMDVLYELK